MSREIKFRAWDKKRQYFHYRMSNICLTLSGRLMWQFGYQVPDLLDDEEAANYVLQQFTGLHDKNGVEIYEGDILKNHDDPTLLGTVLFGYYAIGRDSWGVEFQTPCFCQEWFDKSGYACIGDCIEVIGNIYENPELLEGK